MSQGIQSFLLLQAEVIVLHTDNRHIVLKRQQKEYLQLEQEDSVDKKECSERQ